MRANRYGPARPGRGPERPAGRAALLGLALAVAAIGPLAGRQAGAEGEDERPRVREAGLVVGTLPVGSHDAITDVPGVRVGHATVRLGDSIRTGVTAVLPHGGNVFRDKVRAAVAVGNGFGKLVGLSQVNELGEIETPILLTGTLSVFRAADALLDTLLVTPGNEDARSMNPVVGETNDGYLSDIRARPITSGHVRHALRTAAGGPVEEGSVGAGTGTTALGFKGGIGTASRRLPEAEGGYTLGVLVQTNYGGELRVLGVPVGRELRRQQGGEEGGDGGGGDRGDGARPSGAEDGSVMIVVATDAPLEFRELQRVAFRTFLGIGRTGSTMSHGSGDYAIAFSTSDAEARHEPALLSALFRAAVEATEEAVLNSLFRATTVVGRRGRRVEALPVEAVLDILRRHGRIPARSEPERDGGTSRDLERRGPGGA